MAEKNKEDIEAKEHVREKSKLTGKIVNKSLTAFIVEYKLNGVSYGARVEYDARLHSKLGVGDDIQISL